MTVKIIHKNSRVEFKNSTADQLEYGELALNYNESGPYLQCKGSDDEVVQLGGVFIGATAPGNPLPGKWWLSGTTLHIYDGIKWIPIAGGGGGGGGSSDPVYDGKLTLEDEDGNTLGTFTANQATNATITIPTSDFSGSWNDLTDKPTIGNGKITIQESNGNDVGEFTVNQAGNLIITLPPGASFSGSYDDLTNKPTIGDGSIEINGGAGITASGDNATANQVAGTARTLTAKIGAGLDFDGDGNIIVDPNFNLDGNITAPGDGKLTIKDGADNTLGEFTANQDGDTEVVIPAGGGTVHWDDIDGKPDCFNPCLPECDGILSMRIEDHATLPSFDGGGGILDESRPIHKGTTPDSFDHHPIGIVWWDKDGHQLRDRIQAWRRSGDDYYCQLVIDIPEVNLPTTITRSECVNETYKDPIPEGTEVKFTLLEVPSGCTETQIRAEQEAAKKLGLNRIIDDAGGFLDDTMQVDWLDQETPYNYQHLRAGDLIWFEESNGGALIKKVTINSDLTDTIEFYWFSEYDTMPSTQYSARDHTKAGMWVPGLELFEASNGITILRGTGKVYHDWFYLYENKLIKREMVKYNSQGDGYYFSTYQKGYLPTPKHHQTLDWIMANKGDDEIDDLLHQHPIIEEWADTYKDGYRGYPYSVVWGSGATAGHHLDNIPINNSIEYYTIGRQQFGADYRVLDIVTWDSYDKCDCGCYLSTVFLIRPNGNGTPTAWTPGDPEPLGGFAQWESELLPGFIPHILPYVSADSNFFVDRVEMLRSKRQEISE